MALALLAACSRAPQAEVGTRAAVGSSTATLAASTPVGTATGVPAGGAVQSAAGIAWRHPRDAAELDALFAEARASGRPVFLYWGAAWCPPCNQVKATLFGRPDFVEKSRAFLPVYLDGDLPGAQRLGARFGVVGYPTMVLLRPDGRELTRLPGEIDAERYLQVMSLALGDARPVRELLAQARRAPAALDAEDWRRLAYYGWDTDEQRLLPRDELPDVLQQLAAACPPEQEEAGTRLLLKALAARAEAAGGAEAQGEPPRRRGRAGPAATDAAARQRLLELLADDRLARRNLDLITAWAAPLSRALSAPGTPEREQLLATWAAALDRLTADARLSQGDRIAALAARVELARLAAPAGPTPPASRGAAVAEPAAAAHAASGAAAHAASRAMPPAASAAGPSAAPPLGPVLLEHVRAQVARADREVTDPVERQSVIPNAADVLSEAGLLDESDRLLEAELKRSIAPYYAMLGLAGNAKARGDRAGALAWYARAYEAAQGPATRLQWGSGYVNALIELAPQDAARIGAAAGRVLGELSGQPDAFYGRSVARLERMSRALLGWADAAGAGRERMAVLSRLREERDGLCATLPAGDPQRAACARLFTGRPTRPAPNA
jgi:thiol-disulfide isomerase/thioredoxin